MTARLCSVVCPCAAVALLVSACATAGGSEAVAARQGSGGVLRIVGVVRYLDVEGGVFVIRAADGAQYKPIDLPKPFQQDGLEVEVEARRRDDMVSFAMVGPLIEIVRIQKRAGGGPVTSDARPGLRGTSWRLEELGGTRALDAAQATLQFSKDSDSVSGNASCNQFRGSATIANGSIAFGPLATTRKYCSDEGVMKQEAAYLAALGKAERFEMKAQSLYIYGGGGAATMRFTAPRK